MAYAADTLLVEPRSIPRSGTSLPNRFKNGIAVVSVCDFLGYDIYRFVDRPDQAAKELEADL